MTCFKNAIIIAILDIIDILDDFMNSKYPSPLTPVVAFLQNPLFWIVLVALLAMGGALQADFYMDDYMFILNSNGNAPNDFRLTWCGHTYGSLAIDAMEVSLFQLIPTCLTLLTNWLFPLNSAAAHVWNLAIHLILSLLVFRQGNRLLQGLGIFTSAAVSKQAAFVGALVFACHPLGTEPVHYAKCHMVQLVALFGFWATCEAADFLKNPRRKHGIRFLCAAGLCVISYFPGTVLLGFNLIILVLFQVTSGGISLLKNFMPYAANLRQPRHQVALGLALSALAALASFFLNRYYLIVTGSDGLYPVHVLTQGRVFWEYVQRIFIPIGLASDHYQPWSNFQDTGAVFRLAGFVLLGLAAAALALRRGSAARRGIGLLLLFSLIPFAMRMLYLNIEIMVEYRAYNALPWIGLLAGTGLTAIAHRFSQYRLRWIPAAAVVIIFTVLSAERSTVWRSGRSLAENVLAQYPPNNRARTQLQSVDLDEGKYAAVLKRHEEILAVRDQINSLNSLNNGQVVIDPIRADTNVIGSYQFAILARAELEGCAKALLFADRSIATLKKLLPGSFTSREDEKISLVSGDKICAAWPILEARAAVQRAQDAGYMPTKH